MSKGFKGKTCAYCGEPGITATADHVFARQFVPEPLRANLPKVAACVACNNAKSIDEHYLATVLPFGGDHPAVPAMLKHEVPRRLARNRKLHLALSEGQTPVRLDDGGRVSQTVALAIEPERIVRLARHLIHGLHAHHWEPVPKTMWVGAGVLAPAGVAFHNRLMHMNGVRLRGDIGGGLLSYAALRGLEPPYISAWWLRLFGGVLLAGDPSLPDYGTRDLYGMVATQPHPEMFPP